MHFAMAAGHDNLSAMPLRIAFAVVIAVVFVSPARSEPNGCYWNAAGLPYSVAAPPFVDVPPGFRRNISGTPEVVTVAFIMSAPDLAFKSACGVLDDQDMANARRIYRRWGCSPESSLGQMVEGLPTGETFVWELMTALPVYFEAHRQELADFCAFIDSVPPQCFRGTPIEGDENDERIKELNAKQARLKPECVDKWPRFKEFEDVVHELLSMSLDPPLREVVRRDRALLESAGVD